MSSTRKDVAKRLESMKLSNMAFNRLPGSNDLFSRHWDAIDGRSTNRRKDKFLNQVRRLKADG